MGVGKTYPIVYNKLLNLIGTKLVNPNIVKQSFLFELPVEVETETARSRVAHWLYTVLKSNDPPITSLEGEVRIEDGAIMLGDFELEYSPDFTEIPYDYELSSFLKPELLDRPEFKLGLVLTPDYKTIFLSVFDPRYFGQEESALVSMFFLILDSDGNPINIYRGEFNVLPYSVVYEMNFWSEVRTTEIEDLYSYLPYILIPANQISFEEFLHEGKKLDFIPSDL